MTTPDSGTQRFRELVDRGLLSSEQLDLVLEAAAARGKRPEWILVHEMGVPRRTLLDLLGDYHGCPSVQFDERLSVPPELLEGADPQELLRSGRFPLLLDDEAVVVAATDPGAKEVRRDAAVGGKTLRQEPWVAFEEDVGWYVEDFLHAAPGKLTGAERTGLAFWRNTMAQWRTRLACYRTDFAKSRTHLALLRWGLGLIALANILLRTSHPWSSAHLSWVMIAAGACVIIASVPGYWNIRRTTLRPPGHQTLVEVTSATLQFLEPYTPATSGDKAPSRLTMLARLGALLEAHRTIVGPPPTQKERAPLARERNVLAGQRTVGGCYRTIYARARTGLAFIRTGVSFASLGLGLIRYFGLSLLTLFDALLVLGGLLLVGDGLWWYLPVRKEQAEIPASLRCLGG